MLVPLLPCATVKLFGEAVSVNLPNASTVRVSVVVALRLPETPLMVTVTVPAFAVLAAVRVRVLVGNAGFGLNTAVTPAGSPDALSVTLLLNPFTGVMVMVLWPLAPPFEMVTEFGEAERVKLCTKACTVRLSVVVFVKLPDTPWIVTVTVPVAAVGVAVKVSVLVLVAGLGLKFAVTPLGKFEAERVTLPLKPSCGVIVMVVVAWPPCVTVTLPGLADKVKFGPVGANALIRPAPFGLPQPPHML